MTAQPFAGGLRVMWGSLAVGALGLLLTLGRALVGGEAGHRLAVFSYLLAFTYWLGIALSALVLLMIFHACKARWMVVSRRVLELMSCMVCVFALLFLPVAFQLKTLYPWASPSAGSEELAQLVAHRAPYLNTTLFLVRAAIYFAVWITFSLLFLRWSTRQDHDRAPGWTVKSWRLGAAGLPAVAFTLTFAAVDWLMSLGVHWLSSMWGVYFFAGSFIAALALLVVILAWLNGTPALDHAVKPAHWLNLGKFMLAFTCFWAYIAFSQYMLTWVANLPENIPWLLARGAHGWNLVGIALILGHFMVPFVLLLSRRGKLQPKYLSAVAVWILAMHYLDLYWVVMPEVRPWDPMLDWVDLAAWVGVGGLAIGCFVFVLRGRHALPIGDPFLEDSLHYERTM